MGFWMHPQKLRVFERLPELILPVALPRLAATLGLVIPSGRQNFGRPFATHLNGNTVFQQLFI